MKKLVLNIVLTITILIIIVAGSYFIGIGVLGGSSFSLNSKDWVDFSSYFNGILSPILAAIAAVIAYYSLFRQITISRKESSLNEQISNYLNNINLLKSIILSESKLIIV